MAALPRTSRLWTQEQVQWVLDEIETGKTHKDIADLFNATFAGVNTIKTDHIKYIKAQYRNRTRVDAKPAGTGNVASAPASYTSVQQAIHKQEAAGKATAGATITQAQPNAMGHEQTAPVASPDEPEWAESDPLLLVHDIHAVWHDGAHGNCRINGHHKHTSSGGLTFPSAAALQDTVRKTRVFAPLPSKEVVGQLLDQMNKVTTATLENIDNPPAPDHGGGHTHWSDFFTNLSTQPAVQNHDNPNGRGISNMPAAALPLPHGGNSHEHVPAHNQAPDHKGDAWRTGPHGDCSLPVQHRHEVDGGISFPSLQAAAELIGRTNGSIRLEDLAQMMGSLPPHGQ